MKATEFFSTETIADGKKVPLFRPDGTDSGEWIHLISAESKESALLGARMYSELAKCEDKDKGVFEKRLDINIAYLAGHVKDWSFDEECTAENVCDTLRNSQRFRDEIATTIENRDFFYGSSDD